ncbi:MAG: methionyl-tRNA formyltransferase [Cyanobacteria bacterium P01_A01_bin.123]
MRIVFFGTPQFAVPSLEALLAHPDFEVAAVVTQPDKRRGRGKQVSPSPVKAIALAADCPVWQPKRIKQDAETLDQLDRLEADAFVVVAYGQILSQLILDMPRLGCINAHGSLLPAYRGAAPIQWCLYHGEMETGVTTMLMDAGMDTGAMLLKSTLSIGWESHAWDLAQSLASMSADLLVETLQKLAQGTLEPMPQEDAIATYAPLIKKEDYALDWRKSAIALHNQVRGFYPNCTTQFRGEPIKITATIPIRVLSDPLLRDSCPADWHELAILVQAEIMDQGDEQIELGAIVAILKHYGPVVQTGDGLLLLQTVKPSGKGAQSGWDFANGSRLTVGERFQVT